MKGSIFILALLISPLFNSNSVDCIWGAKDVESYRVLETGYGAKIYFSGGYGSSDFIIKLDGAIYYKTFNEIFFIKDDFCDWEDDVLVIDDEVFGVQKVTKVD